MNNFNYVISAFNNSGILYREVTNTKKYFKKRYKCLVVSFPWLSDEYKDNLYFVMLFDKYGFQNNVRIRCIHTTEGRPLNINEELNTTLLSLYDTTGRISNFHYITVPSQNDVCAEFKLHVGGKDKPDKNKEIIECIQYVRRKFCEEYDRYIKPYVMSDDEYYKYLIVNTFKNYPF